MPAESVTVPRQAASGAGDGPAEGLPDFVSARLVQAHPQVIFIGPLAAARVPTPRPPDGAPTQLAGRRVLTAASVAAARRLRTVDGEGADAAVIGLADTEFGEPDTDILLGAACRDFPARLLVEVQCGSGDPERALQAATRLYAFGFRRLGRSSDAGRPGIWYEFSLRDYKAAPDWLNARYWAHPERFDLDDTH